VNLFQVIETYWSQGEEKKAENAKQNEAKQKTSFIRFTPSRYICMMKQTSSYQAP
jgi:hypothetical protein